MKSRKILMGILVACALAAATPARAHHGMHGDMHHDRMGEGCCEQNLPPDKARLAEGAMHQVMEKNRPLFERMHRLHDKMRAIATADRFNKKAFMATADEMAAVHMKMEKNRAKMMAWVAEKLTASERRAMATCMDGHFHHGDESHEGHHGRGNSHNDYGNLNQ